MVVSLCTFCFPWHVLLWEHGHEAHSVWGVTCLSGRTRLWLDENLPFTSPLTSFLHLLQHILWGTTAIRFKWHPRSSSCCVCTVSAFYPGLTIPCFWCKGLSLMHTVYQANGSVRDIAPVALHLVRIQLVLNKNELCWSSEPCCLENNGYVVVSSLQMWSKVK